MRAFSMVSAVVKVLETTTMRVVSGLRPFRARATSTGSTLARKRRFLPFACACTAASAGSMPGASAVTHRLASAEAVTSAQCLASAAGKGTRWHGRAVQVHQVPRG